MFGIENPDVSFFECAPWIRELVFLKFFTYKPKKVSRLKRQQMDHRVAWRGPFTWFQFHFRVIVAEATHQKRRSNPPKVGAIHRRCASPPPALSICQQQHTQGGGGSDAVFKSFLTPFSFCSLLSIPSTPKGSVRPTYFKKFETQNKKLKDLA